MILVNWLHTLAFFNMLMLFYVKEKLAQKMLYYSMAMVRSERLGKSGLRAARKDPVVGEHMLRVAGSVASAQDGSSGGP